MREQVLILRPLVLGLSSSLLPVRVQGVGFGKAFETGLSGGSATAGRLNLARERLSLLTPARLLLARAPDPWPLSLAQPQVSGSCEQQGVDEASGQEDAVRRTSIACDFPTRSPGPRPPSCVGRTTVRTEPAGGGPRGCHGGRRGHPQLAELGKGTPAQRTGGLTPVSISQPTRRP